MVMAMSVLGGLNKPELMERVANQTWATKIVPERRIVARVDAACDGSWKQRLLDPLHPHLKARCGEPRC